MQATNYRSQLKTELKRRKFTNPQYSLRSFAKTLEVSPSFLSNVMNGRKTISIQTALKFSKRLGYSQGQAFLFCKLVQGVQKTDTTLAQGLEILSGQFPNAQTSTETLSLSLDTFEMISDWHHYALLVLVECRGFQILPSWIAQRLGVSIPEAKAATERLLRLGLLKKSGKTLKRSEKFMATPTDIPSQALRNFHLQMIEKARQALETQAVLEREISSITLAVDPSCLEEAKIEIRKFRKKMADLFENKPLTEVYQLNVQFFRLTQDANKTRGAAK